MTHVQALNAMWKTPPVQGSTTTTTFRVDVKRSPHIYAFCKHYPVRILVDTGAETNMIWESTAKHIGAKITKSSQTAFQADGQTQLIVTGETKLELSRNEITLHLDLS